MLSIKSAEKDANCIPNVLPCGVKHNGQANTSKRYWSPAKVDDEKHVVNFRGRKLQGKTVRVPEGYTGVVVQLPDKEEEVETVKKAFRVDDNSESDDQVAETEARKMAGFDEIMIWEHGQMPDASSDPYMKGMQEWIAFAQTIHGDSM